MDRHIQAFAQFMIVFVPSLILIIGVGVWAHRFVERTNRMGHEPKQLPDDARLQRLEHAVEAIAVEVERLGEGQRFVTKILTEKGSELRAELPSQRGRVITPH